MLLIMESSPATPRFLLLRTKDNGKRPGQNEGLAIVVL